MFKILGCYRPSKWEAKAIGEDLVQFTDSMGLVSIREGGTLRDSRWFVYNEETEGTCHELSADVRGPAWPNPNPGNEIRLWHRDGHNQDVKGRNLPMSLILWANETPTEFLMPGGEIVVPEPYEIVLANNLKVKHRMPAVLGKNRWFFRQAVRTPDWQ